MIKNEDKLVEYLQLIQEPVCRMSTVSAIFKGFAATIVAGISTIPIWILIYGYLDSRFYLFYHLLLWIYII